MQVLEATFGGTRKYLLDLAYHLPEDRFSQHLVVSTLRDPGFARDVQRLREFGHTVTVVQMRRQISPGSDIAAFRQIRGLIKSWEPDVVHSHSSKAGFVARMAAAGLPVASLYTPHCFAFQMRLSSVRRWMYLQLERFAGRHTDLLVLPSQSQQELAVSARVVPRSKTRVVPTGVAPEKLKPNRTATQVRQSLDIPADATVLGTVALLSQQKGHKYLLQALPGLCQDRDIVLLLAGDGPLQQPLKQLAARLSVAECVRFLGYREDIPELLAALDLFVLPSLWEGLPYALLEAMAAKVPVVTTDIPGNNDLVDGATTGWLAAAGDAEGLAAAITEALSDTDEKHRRAHAGYDRILAGHTLSHMINGYIELYSSAGEKSGW